MKQKELVNFLNGMKENGTKEVWVVKCFIK